MKSSKPYLRKACGPRGAEFGRLNGIPPILKNEPLKLNLQILPRNAGGYDAGGAYWGWSSDRTQLYIAFDNAVCVQVFCWAKSRDEAKALVRKELPNAVFYK